jgi:polysaccharide pyruvyl transferase WcaK-like protein
VTYGAFTRKGERPVSAAPRVGLFGLLGSGNLGNDASFEVVLAYLRAHHPDAVLDAMCMGPERLRSEYGIEAVPLQWYRKYQDRVPGPAAAAFKVLGKAIDAYRTASWARRHDVVIVPGMGVLEASLPLKASGTPYAMFLLCASGKLFGTKVALVSVGATIINQRLTRWLFDWAARLAFYRSYRDTGSREAMRQRGLDVTGDQVFPDLVFGLPVPPSGPGDPRTVGVGVMAYFGNNDDRGQADQIHTSYIDAMTSFVRWLIDTGHRAQLFWGDDVDQTAVQEILAGLRQQRPGLDPASVVAEPFSSLRELIDAMTSVGTVVGIRYHNVMSALKLSRPTISIGYSSKHDCLMADMGVPEFALSARALDADHLIRQFTEMEGRAVELRLSLEERNKARVHDLNRQFALLSSLLFPAGGAAPALAETADMLVRP